MILKTKKNEIGNPIQTAVVTGGHSFNVFEFHRLFWQLENVEAYIQHMDDFASSSAEIRHSYDVILFYTMLLDGPADDGHPWYAGRPRSVLKELGQTEQGIFMLHHSILAYREWPVWSQIVGFPDLTHDVTMAQNLLVEVEDPNHPITSEVSDWWMIDETYKMCDPDPDSQVLLTTKHPTSMRVLAWTRQYQNSRVFCYQSGHDNRTWDNLNFITVLRRGIEWCAGRI